MAEWLGRGLQNLVRRFESARDLQKQLAFLLAAFFMELAQLGKKKGRLENPVALLLLQTF